MELDLACDVYSMLILIEITCYLLWFFSNNFGSCQWLHRQKTNFHHGIDLSSDNIVYLPPRLHFWTTTLVTDLCSSYSWTWRWLSCHQSCCTGLYSRYLPGTENNVKVCYCQHDPLRSIWSKSTSYWTSTTGHTQLCVVLLLCSCIRSNKHGVCLLHMLYTRVDYSQWKNT